MEQKTLSKEKLKDIYEDGIEQGFIKNLTFEQWEIKYFEMDKEIKEMNKKEKERLDGLKRGIVEAQKIIFG